MGFRVGEEGFFQDWFDWFGSCWILGTPLWKMKVRENLNLVYFLVEREGEREGKERGKRGERERGERGERMGKRLRKRGERGEREERKGRERGERGVREG